MVAAVALPGTAMAAPAPVKLPPATAKPAPPFALTPGTRRITLSPEGNAIASHIYGTPDPRAAQIQSELASIKQEQARLIAGPTIDVDKLEPLIRREQELQSEARMRKNDRFLALLRALSDPDRRALLQNLANPPKPQNAKPAEPPR